MTLSTNVTTFLAQLLTNPGFVGDIADSAANITLSLPALELAAPSIGSITSTNGVVTVGVSAFSADQGALDKITNGFAVSDTVSAIDAALPLLASDTNIVSITGTDGQVDVSAAAFKADQRGLDKITAGFVVSDTAANISANLDALNADSLLLSITITDSAPVGVSVGQLTSDATAIGKLHNADLGAPQLAVSDTAAAIAAGLSVLQSDQASISTITASGGPVVVSTAGFAAARAALDKIVGGFTVKDTVAALTGAIAALAADGHIGAVIATDGPFVASLAVFAADRALLDKIAGGFTVSDTAAAIQANLASLAADAHITAITATGGPVSVGVASFAAARAALDKITGGFTVSDTAAAVQGALASLAADPHIVAITASGGPLTVTASSFSAARAALDKIAGGFTIADTASGVGTILDQLRDTHATRVTITNSAPIALTVAQLTGDAAAIAKLHNADGSAVTFAVADTGANVAAALATLAADAGAIASITTTGAPASVTVAEFAADQATLDIITGGFAIVDTSANIQIGLATLVADTSHIVSIRSTSGMPGVSFATFQADKTTLDKIVTRFGIADTAATLAANQSAIHADLAIGFTTTLVGGVAVAQSVFNLDGSLSFQDTIKTLANGDIVYHCFGGSALAGHAYASFDNVVDHTGYLSSQTRYDAGGAVLGETVFNRDGSVYFADAVTRDAAGNTVHHFAGGSFFTGQAFAAFDNVFSAAGSLVEQVLYNASGALTEQTIYNPDGSIYLSGGVTTTAAGKIVIHYSTGSDLAGKPFASFDNVVNASGVLQSQTLYNASGIATEKVSFNADGSVSLVDTITRLPNGSIDNHYAGGSYFTGQNFAAFDNVTSATGVLQSQTLLDAGGAPLQQTTYNTDGSVALQDTISRPSAGQTLYHYAGGSFFNAKTFSAFDNLIDGQGNLLSQQLDNKDGSHSFTVPGSNLTIAAVHNDTFDVTGQNETISFGAAGFGADVFKGYTAGDVFSFSKSLFANDQDLSGHVSGTSSATITDAHGDTLTLAGVAPSSLTAGMFKFV